VGAARCVRGARFFEGAMLGSGRLKGNQWVSQAVLGRSTSTPAYPRRGMGAWQGLSGQQPCRGRKVGEREGGTPEVLRICIAVHYDRCEKIRNFPAILPGNVSLFFHSFRSTPIRRAGPK
jgi:hypothetical protein